MTANFRRHFWKVTNGNEGIFSTPFM